MSQHHLNMTYRNMMCLFVVFYTFSLCEGRSFVGKDKDPKQVTKGLFSQGSRYRRGCPTDCPSNLCVQSGLHDVELDDGSCCVCGEGSRAICFPSSARVSLENGKSVTMSELQVGHKVQTVSTNGSITYSEVRSFLRVKDTHITMYKSLTTSLNRTMSLTRNHIIYSRTGSFDKFHAVYADQVAIGDEVLVQKNDEFTPEKVLNVSYSMMQGIYAPVTIQGNVVVDGLLASCYGSFDHDLVHILIKPVHWFPEIMEWIFGTDIVSPGYATCLEDIGRWALPTYLMY